MHLGSSDRFSLRPSGGENGSAIGPPSPAVSVLVPTRDRAAMLRRALRSVLAQRSIDLEVVVIDDGSIDDTEQAVRSLRDVRVHVLRHETARGVAAARNAGAAASGDLASVGRAAIAALHPRPAAVRSRATSLEDAEWAASAQTWIRA